MGKSNQIGKIEIVPVRQAFGHEALDFTVWLEQNIDALADRLGIDLTVLEREKEVGSFKVDLLCEDGNGNTVIIENQLERTDHDHLGKLLTYMINLDAKTAIWVTPEPRQEHERVIEWLNESTNTNLSFYLIRVEALRIGGSPFAPLFSVLSAPDEQSREIGKTKGDLAQRHYDRLEFWTTLLDRSKSKTNLFSNRSPSKDHWLATGSGRSGITFNYLILKDHAAITLNIDVGDQTTNKAIFDEFASQSQDIEYEFGERLNWYRLDDKKACHIDCQIYEHGSLSEPDTWAALQDLMIDKMVRFDRVFRDRIKKLEH
jgi:hypothetical protein